jgi:L-lactate utilization protein LutC
MNTFDHIAGDEVIKNTIEALKANGIDAEVVHTGHDAKKKALQLIPEGKEVMTMTSVTVDEIGLSEVLNDSGKYDAVRGKLYAMDRETDGLEMQKLGAAPEYVTGSVHAVTEDGKVVIASNTGSQLPAYVYGSSHVIWIVGAQKIVKDLDTALKRVYDYVLPLEADRARKAYGAPGSNVSKLLVINKEIKPGRIKMFIVKEKLGF